MLHRNAKSRAHLLYFHLFIREREISRWKRKAILNEHYWCLAEARRKHQTRRGNEHLSGSELNQAAFWKIVHEAVSRGVSHGKSLWSLSPAPHPQYLTEVNMSASCSPFASGPTERKIRPCSLSLRSTRCFIYEWVLRQRSLLKVAAC